MAISHLRHSENHMATTFDFVVSCPGEKTFLATEVLKEAHEDVSRCEEVLSDFLKDSPIFQLNESRAFLKIKLPTFGIELIEQAEYLKTLTKGAFDITAKSNACPFPRIKWDKNTNMVWRTSSEVRVGFGAIGKGFSLDRVRTLLEQHGFYDYVLSAGGSSIILSGFSSPDIPWTFGWSWEKSDDGSPRGLSFEHRSGISIAIGVSGVHEKGEHLIDPRTLARTNLLKSAFFAHSSAAEADALSTALYISGTNEPPNSTEPYAYAVIDHQHVPTWNGYFQKLWGAQSFITQNVLRSL